MLSTDPDRGSLPRDVVDYVVRLAPDFRRETMLNVLAREVADHNAYLRTGGEHNKVVRMCLPGTTTVYALVAPSAGALVMPESYAHRSPYAYVQNHRSHPIKIKFPRDDDKPVEEFHRLAEIAYRLKGGKANPGR